MASSTRIGNAASTVKDLTVVVSFFIATILIVLVIVSLFRDAPLIEDFTLPETLIKQGYTPKLAATIVSADTRVVAQNATRNFDVGRPRNSVSVDEPIEAKIPGSDFTVRSVADFIRRLFGRSERNIHGAIVQEGDKLKLVMRQGDTTWVGETPRVVGSKDAVADLLCEAADLAVKFDDPFVLAAKTYNEEADKGSYKFEKTREMIEYTLAQYPDDYFAKNLQCAIDIRGSDGTTEAKCQDVINIDSARWPGHANLGYYYYLQTLNLRDPGGKIVTSQGKELCRKADEQFSIVDKMHPLKVLYKFWGECLEALDRTDEAKAKAAQVETQKSAPAVPCLLAEAPPEAK